MHRAIQTLSFIRGWLQIQVALSRMGSGIPAVVVQRNVTDSARHIQSGESLS